MQYIPVARDPHHFQQAPTPDQLIAMCHTAFGPDVTIERIVELGAGFFNNTFTVEIADMPKLILRVAPAPAAHVYPNEKLLMRREYNVGPFLAPVCPVAPRTIMADFTHQVIDRDYMFQSFLEGEVWGAVHGEMSDAEKDAVRRQLGAIARRINSVEGETFGFPHPDPGFARWSDFLVHFLSTMCSEVEALGFEAGNGLRLLRWLEANRPLFDQIRRPVLLHGDMWPQNILIRRTDATPEITGLLDAERALWGDPLFEWTYNLGTVHPAFWEGYGPRDEGPDAQRRALAYKGIWLVLVIMESSRYQGKPHDRTYDQLAEVIAALG